MNKLPITNSLDLWEDDPGCTADVDIVLDTFWDYWKHGTYPSTGGYFAQDTHIVDSFKSMSKRVKWYMQNEKKRDNLPSMDDVFAKRRANLKGNDDG